MDWEFVLLDKKDKIATITLNRPEKYNAFAGNMRNDLLEAVKKAGSDPEILVIVITGAGDKAFCTGGDVNERVAGTSKAVSPIASSERHTMSEIVLAINSFEKPFIAAVNGVAAGGGCNLALSCDIRIASEKARFGEVFTRRGTHPDWGGIYFLPRLVGYAKAAELLFSGEIIDAREALAIGMVNKVVPHEDLMPATYKMAEQIVKSAPIPIAFIKRGLQNFYRMDLRQALDYEAYALEVCRRSDDFMEGFTSFLEKRDPVFRGR
jgi:2-(1,2-epoxy-1,2-dihydrophenyl)acetyl-CoA isomerase